MNQGSVLGLLRGLLGSGMSREKIDAHHHGSASKVSMGLMPAEQLAGIFGRYLDVTAVISDEDMYQVAGKRR